MEAAGVGGVGYENVSQDPQKYEEQALDTITPPTTPPKKKIYTQNGLVYCGL